MSRLYSAAEIFAWVLSLLESKTKQEISEIIRHEIEMDTCLDWWMTEIEELIMDTQEKICSPDFSWEDLRLAERMLSDFEDFYGQFPDTVALTREIHSTKFDREEYERGER